MKNKRIVNIVIICVVLIAVGLLALAFLDNKKDEVYEPHKIENLKETKLGKLPDFGVALGGAYYGAMVNSDIEKMKAYEFDATFDNGWEIVKNHYIGIRVKEAFEVLDIKDYAQVKFVNSGLVSVIYEATDITDDTYFIIKRDGKFVSDDVIGVMSFDKDYNYSVENLYSMNIVKKG